MPITLNGSGTVTGISTGGISDAKAVADASMPAGSVLQVKSVTKTDTSSVTTNATPQDISGLSITITPRDTSSKFIITGKVQMSLQYATTGNIHIKVNDLEVGTAPSSFSRPVAHAGTGYLGVGQQYACYSMAVDMESTSSTGLQAGSNTIKLQMSQPDTTSGHTLYINRSQTDPNGVAGPRYVSTLTVYEVAG